ncbi:hypothetical protein [Nocardia sp. NPDC005745]
MAAPGHSIDADALLQLCRSQVAKYKIPARIVEVDSLPLTPSGRLGRSL